jgi:hypothetical protein
MITKKLVLVSCKSADCHQCKGKCKSDKFVTIELTPDSQTKDRVLFMIIDSVTYTVYGGYEYFRTITGNTTFRVTDYPGLKINDIS